MKEGSYFGSVRFLKHLRITVFALLILIPTGIAVSERISLDAVQCELESLKAELSVPEPEDVVVEQKVKPAGELSAPEILASQRIIAHGLGAVDEQATLNCLECFEESYAAGIRVFEVDLRMTRDGSVVLRHDWRGGLQEGVSETSLPTLEEFLAKPVSGQYTPLSFRDLLHLMEQHPDVCVITDTKFIDTEEVTLQFSAILDDAYEEGLSYLFDRMIIQVYTPLMFSIVDHLHHFPHYIFTLYNSDFNGTEDSFRQQAIFCQENGIMGITMSDYWWAKGHPDYYPIANWRGIRLFLHTVNDADAARAYFDSGISGVYSDSLLPADFPDIYRDLSAPAGSS